MGPCANCGAKLFPDALACAYCHAPTPAAARLREQEAHARAAHAHYAAQAQHHRQWLSVVSVDTSARHALLAAIFGLVFFCIPIPSVVALVLAARTRRLAREQGLAVPGQTTAAMILAGGTLALFAVGVTAGIVSSVRLDKEKAALRATIERAPASAPLDQPTACAIVHLHLLEHGFAGAGGSLIEGFDCPGALRPGSVTDRAVLEDIRFKTGASKPRLVATACFHRGARWILDDIGVGERCPDAEASPPLAASSARPAATPPSASARAPGSRSPAGPRAAPVPGAISGRDAALVAPSRSTTSRATPDAGR